jgi:hypothetical protein
MAQLKEWRDQKWVRIGRDGSILGECGTSPDKKNPDKKKEEGSKGQTVVSNTKKAKVRTAYNGGLQEVRENHRGCGVVMPGRRKKTLYV